VETLNTAFNRDDRAHHRPDRNRGWPSSFEKPLHRTIYLALWKRPAFISFCDSR
jgi:hypothetical protein